MRLTYYARKLALRFLRWKPKFTWRGLLRLTVAFIAVTAIWYGGALVGYKLGRIHEASYQDDQQSADRSTHWRAPQGGKD